MKRKILGFLLVLSMLFSMAVLPAHAAANGTCGANLTWTLDNSGTLTISGTGDMTNYLYWGDIPWYSSRSSIKTVVIQSGVTSIGDRAFRDCSNLTSITIGNSVTSIGERAFYDCSSLTLITIPDSVTSIGDCAFCYCSSLTSITIPDSVTSIGSYTFSKCSSLTSITIPDSVTSIGKEAFGYCSSLTSITIGNGVTSIGEEAFEGCRSLTSITIPDSVTSIGDDAFSDCSSLTSITIPDSVTSMGERAFYGCSSLTSITIPDSVTSIGEKAFWGCFRLTSITIPNSVTSIGDEAFYFCSRLTSITIGSGVTSIGDMAFYDCRKLEDVYYKGTPEQWSNISIGSDNDYLTSAQLHITRTVTYTGDYEGSKNADYLTTVTFPKPPYGYTYTFKVNDEIWDGVVKGDTTVVVTKTINNYTVIYTGDYTETLTADYLTELTLPTAPYGYTYTFKANGKTWDGIVKGDTTVVVTRAPINYTVTYTGDYTGTENADYLTTVSFPTAPYGYTYTFKVNDEIWDGVVESDTTVVVTKTINNYTITYTGDYTGTLTADYLTELTLPTAPENYIYRFTVNGSAWDGVVRGDTTVRVSRLCDLTALDITNLDEIQKDVNSICGKFYGKYFTPQVTVSENASYRLYRDASCTQSLSSVTLARGENTFYIRVTAESGRQTVYTVTVDLDIPENLGVLTAVQAVGNSMIFSLDKQIAGNPVVKIRYGKNQDNLNYEKTATLDPESGALYISGLPEGESFYFKAVAVYDDIQIESTVVAATTAIVLSNENYVLRMISPSGGSIDHEAGTISGLRVMNSFEKIAVDAEVSPNATWDLYYTATSNTTYKNREVPLTEGRTKTAYIRVKAEDGTEKTYSISIYRQTKSQAPQISVSGGMATITSADGKNIYYTTDGTEPNAITGTPYTTPFAVTEGMTIKAIAKQDNKDEYSDVAEFKVPVNDIVLITPIDVYHDGTNINYEFFAEANKPIYGIFMFAVYDANGKMTSLFEADTLSGETEKLIDGSVSVADKDYSTCKAMLWSSYSEMMPLSSSVLIEK